MKSKNNKINNETFTFSDIANYFKGYFVNSSQNKLALVHNDRGLKEVVEN